MQLRRLGRASDKNDVIRDAGLWCLPIAMNRDVFVIGSLSELLLILQHGGLVSRFSGDALNNAGELLAKVARTQTCFGGTVGAACLYQGIMLGGWYVETSPK